MTRTDATDSTRLYTALLILAAAWFLVSLARAHFSMQHNIETVVLGLLTFAALRSAPARPIDGVIACLLLNYTFGREDTVTRFMVDSGMSSIAALLTGVATLTWKRRAQLPFPAWGVVGWAAVAFGSWLALATAVAVAVEHPDLQDLLWRVTRHLQGFLLFAVAATARFGLGDLRRMVVVLAAALCVRQLFLESNWLFEQNLALLGAVTFPLAVVLAVIRPWSALSATVAIGAVYLAGMILFVRTRGAVVGLVAGSVVMSLLARRRLLGIAGLVIGVGLTGLWAFERGLLDRFFEIYNDGQFVGSAAVRLDIWSSATTLARDHWMFGIGLGNFSNFLSAGTNQRLAFNADNSLVELLVEAGALAPLLYCAVFLAAAIHLWLVARRHAQNWRRSICSGLLGSLTAHLAAGMFLANPSLILTWILLGVTVSLGDSPRSDELAAKHLDAGQNPQ